MDKKRIIIGLSIASVLTFLMCVVPSGNLVCLMALLAIGGMATWEFFNLLVSGGMKASRKWGTIAGLLFVAATWVYMLESKETSFFYQHLPPDTVLWTVLLLAVVSVFFRILAYPDMRNGLENALGTLLGVMYVPFLWSFFIRVFLSGDPTEPAWSGFYLLLCTKMADSGGYFIGTRFGKHKLAPVISPKKSWEGLVGGIIFCVTVNILWLFISKGHLGSFDFSFGDAITLGVLIPIVGTAGDLVESMFKRAVDIKDSNTMVYGLGGILDMIDSILFTAPLLYIYIKFALVN
ncbi:MAG: phosphatidate cytidylyltransferase [Pontiellaceae bacterium]|nr:phosphatidate cytidylyltransferase [Pontiellaceae bacterium]MBN2785549.1 phosphatidate cytidylyltransferase [Pontiellaceae bacterium]